METLEREAWLQERTRGIGGSDWGAILNLKPYGCARRLMYEKLQYEPDYPEVVEGYLERGIALEAIIADAAAKHFDVRLRRPGILPKGVVPEWWKGNPDRVVVPNGVWEGKSMHPVRFRRVKKEGVPPAHTLQVQHYIAQADREYGLYSILEPVGWEFDHKVMQRDDGLINTMMEAGEAFWDQRQREELPERLDPGDSRCRKCQFRWTCQGAALFDAVPELAPGETEEIKDPALQALVEERDQLDFLIKEASQMKEANSDAIREFLGSPRKVKTAEGRAVYWIEFPRQTIDSRAIRAKFPEIYEKYSKVSTVRQLRIY